MLGFRLSIPTCDSEKRAFVKERDETVLESPGVNVRALTAEEISFLDSVAQRWLAESARSAEEKARLEETLAASPLSFAPVTVLNILAHLCAALGRALGREALCDFAAHVEAVRTLKQRFLAACAEHAEINTRLNSPAERLAEAMKGAECAAAVRKK